MEYLNEKERYQSGVLPHDSIVHIAVLAMQQYSIEDEILPGLDSLLENL